MRSWHTVWDYCIRSIHRCSLYNLLVITSASHLYIRRHVNLLWETFRTACYFGHEVLSPRLADFCEVFCFLFSDGYIGLFWLNHEIDDGGIPSSLIQEPRTWNIERKLRIYLRYGNIGGSLPPEGRVLWARGKYQRTRLSEVERCARRETCR